MTLLLFGTALSPKHSLTHYCLHECFYEYLPQSLILLPVVGYSDGLTFYVSVPYNLSISSRIDIPRKFMDSCSWQFSSLDHLSE